MLQVKRFDDEVSFSAIRPSRASNTPGIQKNDDGSVDVYFGPKRPAVKNQIGIDKPKRVFEVLFRFYGPEKDFFEKKWLLPDIEKVS